MSDNKVLQSVKRKPPSAGRGRKKGELNKTTRAAKEAIAFAAEALGGAERLTAWAKEDPANERAFWTTVYPKLLPLQVANADGEEFKTVSRIELVAPNVLSKA